MINAKTDRRPLPRKELLDEIPPDPVNFLREDAGDDKPKLEPNQNQRPQNKTRNRNRQDRPKQEKGNNDAELQGGSPPRPRNQNQRPKPHHEADVPPKRQIHPQQLRNERRSAVALTDPPQQGHSQQHQQNQQHTPNRQRRPNFRQPNKEGDRNNITVEITDGEVRSVKCMCLCSI